MSEPLTHLVITGGQGYIGRRLAEIARGQGLTVITLARKPSCDDAAAWQLGEPLPKLDIAWDRTAVIHLAHDFTDPDVRGRNYNGSLKLFQSAQDVSVARFIFVSSQSARRDAANLYGRIKYGIEQILQGSSSPSIRVGLVYGGTEQGLFGTMLKLVKAAPLLPMVGVNRDVQPIHIDEVCLGLLAYCTLRINGVHGLASPQAMPFRAFLKILAREYYGKGLGVVPVPLWLALTGARLTSLIPFLPTVDRERILGLVGVQKMNCRQDMRTIGVEGQHPELLIRQSPRGTVLMLREGYVFFTYLLGRKPNLFSLRRYAAALRSTYPDEGAVPLPFLVRRMPRLMRLIEPRDESLFATRLRIAAALVEQSGIGVKVFHASKFMAARVILSLVLDAAAYPFRLVFDRR